MLDKRVLEEMIFYATTNDYSDAGRYEKFCLDCKLDIKGFEIGNVVKDLARSFPRGKRIKILETASATGLTAVGVCTKLLHAGIAHTYTSLDIERNLLSYAKFRRRWRKFVRSDFNKLPFAASCFDI